MKQQELKELLKRAERQGLPSGFQALVTDLKEFTRLYEKKDNHIGDPEFIKEFMVKRNRLVTTFNEVTLSLGINKEVLLEYFNNPNNFSSEEWNKLQEVKQKTLALKE